MNFYRFFIFLQKIQFSPKNSMSFGSKKNWTELFGSFNCKNFYQNLYWAPESSIACPKSSFDAIFYYAQNKCYFRFFYQLLFVFIIILCHIYFAYCFLFPSQKISLNFPFNNFWVSFVLNPIRNLLRFCYFVLFWKFSMHRIFLKC